jgi:ring-1,2-phenylacetyl-CoA epoxidase subunit PaaE
VLNFRPLPVTAVEPIAEDAVSVTLAVPAELREEFSFHSGQYVTVRRIIEGREERRTYSIVTTPGCGALRLGVRIQTGGRMSRDLAHSLRAGQVLEVASPGGRFRTQIDPARAHRYVAFAAGSGITPILSLAADILAREPRSLFTLFYGNRSISRTMFLEDTLALKDSYLDRFSVHFLMSREPQHTALLNGRINGAKIAELARHFAGISNADEYFICGPGEMTAEVREAIKTLNGSAMIRIERFAIAAPPAAPAAPAARQGASAAPAQEVLATIAVTMDGRRRSFTMAPGDASVLDAAERAGLELPFSCRAGICATCRAKIVRGGAVMTHNIALQPWETEAGFILCCQARPTGASLELSYDEK